MIAVDTNVLVRFLVEDDRRQSAEAAALIERALEQGQLVFLPKIVLCELVWVLSYAYAYSRGQIAPILQQLRRSAQLQIEATDEVQRAIDSYSSGRGDFADYLIAESSIANGCSVVATFDRVLHSDPRFKPPSAWR
jgi:predicted nucleic-acid-binding protein